MRRLKINGIYRHFKGKYYIVVDRCIHCDTQEEYVIYRALYGDNHLWIRPLSNFLSEVDHNKYPNVKQKYRFELKKIDSIVNDKK